MKIISRWKEVELMRIISKWEERLKACVKKYGHFVLRNLIFGVLVYFMMMSEGLVNSHDGVQHTSHYNSGAWEVQLGRGMLYYLDRIRLGVVSVPLNCILTLLIISITGAVILNLFSVRNKVMGAVIAMILIANPVTCATLSYNYTSVNYGVAFFSSVLAVYFVCRCRKAAAVLSGGVFLAISLGCYQAYFNVTCLLILMFLIQMLLQDRDGQDIAGFLTRGAFAVAAGGAIYFISSKLMLLQFGVGLSGYGGASSVSLKTILLNLPQSIPQCYKNYYEFFRNKMLLNSSRMVVLLLLIGIAGLTGFCVVYHFHVLLRRNWRYALCFMAALCLIPVASSGITILAYGSRGSRLVMMGFLVSVVMLIVLVPKEGKASFFAKRGYAVLMFALLWFSILSVTNEQLALKEGKRASVSIAEAVLNELITDGHLEERYAIALIGEPRDNGLFASREAWQNVYGDARFGEIWNSRLKFWQQLYIEYCGVRLNFCSQEKYNALIQMEEVAAMPNFPEEGSITKIDGVTVVKISDTY